MVDGFTVRHLRRIGSPATVARLRSRSSSVSLLGVPKAREARIVGTATWKCFGVGRTLALGFQTRGATLSAPSVACLSDEFQADPNAQDAYIEQTVRQLQGKMPELSSAMVRAGSILNRCLNADEKRVLGVG